MRATKLADNVPYEVWHSDFIIDTNVVGNARDDAATERKLSDLVQRMTAKEGYGKGWMAEAAFRELLGPKGRGYDTKLLEVFLPLAQTDRLRVFAPLATMVAAEYAGEPPRFMDREYLVASISAAIKGGTIEGTSLGEVRDELLDWKAQRAATYAETLKEWREKFRTEKEFAADVHRALNAWNGPSAYSECDDVAKKVLTEAIPHATDGLERALKDPDGFLCLWTHALLLRLAQYAQTIPRDTCGREFPGLVEVLKPHENDFLDAYIAGCGGQCGILLTEDKGLMARVKMLHERKLIRLQAFTLDFVAANWRPPVPRDGVG